MSNWLLLRTKLEVRRYFVLFFCGKIFCSSRKSPRLPLAPIFAVPVSDASLHGGAFELWYWIREFLAWHPSDCGSRLTPWEQRLITAVDLSKEGHDKAVCKKEMVLVSGGAEGAVGGTAGPGARYVDRQRKLQVNSRITCRRGFSAAKAILRLAYPQGPLLASRMWIPGKQASGHSPVWAP